MIPCPDNWHPDPDQRDGQLDLSGFKVKVDPHFGDERVAVTCYCGHPRLGYLDDAVFAADHVTLVSGTFRVDDPWGWPWNEEVST